ncbi:oxidoreductase [Testudinibacter sp. TR-2022]|uniref:oxidoreductase n=1 Tax=Testudinibacter sp. TR-2022 TaxID=2585029 RepID=UPI001118B7DE|nr:oxidoreductase [Testudinibacter sp. TR-2022]TNH03516.1 oxidoreductase [Pasteurellaceae bacterium Phil31]TNH07912.1 oxidoreductase [Testudinibacter sp. TR-2022]TNH10351.1 oxidoreductase [Testudinibacter sp. TR-2022]TNH14495.1 oxidoreductase [Testudinibacter sp. TR-2022]TNH20837.1 oxidoreductase [Testudinibacter sp. TR-2022]
MQTKLNIVIAAEFELAEKIADLLEQSELPVEKIIVAEIYPFGEEQGLRFNNRAVEQQNIEELDWSDKQYLFFAGETKHAGYLAQAADSGCVVIDLNGVCAALQDVPLIVPGFNDPLLSELRNRNIVSLADPQISQLLLTCGEILLGGEINRLLVSSMLPASYVNSEQVKTLAGQTARLLNGIPLDEGEVRLAFDAAPFKRHSSERLLQQFQKILPNSDIQLVIHQLQSAVFYGLAQQVTALSDYQTDVEQWQAVWQANELLVWHEAQIVTPVINGEQYQEQDQLHISDVQALENGIQFWSVCDEQRFSLALLGVKLAETAYLQGY